MRPLRDRKPVTRDQNQSSDLLAMSRGLFDLSETKLKPPILGPLISGSVCDISEVAFGPLRDQTITSHTRTSDLWRSVCDLSGPFAISRGHILTSQRPNCNLPYSQNPDGGSTLNSTPTPPLRETIGGLKTSSPVPFLCTSTVTSVQASQRPNYNLPFSQNPDGGSTLNSTPKPPLRETIGGLKTSFLSPVSLYFNRPVSVQAETASHSNDNDAATTSSHLKGSLNRLKHQREPQLLAVVGVDCLLFNGLKLGELLLGTVCTTFGKGKKLRGRLKVS
jgi:hypothetical protein